MIVLVKFAIVALIVGLPSGLGIWLGVAHGAVLLILLLAAAVPLVMSKRRGRTMRPASAHLTLHRHGCGHAKGRANDDNTVKNRRSE